MEHPITFYGIYMHLPEKNGEIFHGDLLVYRELYIVDQRFTPLIPHCGVNSPKILGDFLKAARREAAEQERKEKVCTNNTEGWVLGGWAPRTLNSSVVNNHG